MDEHLVRQPIHLGGHACHVGREIEQRRQAGDGDEAQCRRPFRLAQTLPPALRFVTVAGLPALFDFPPDMARVPAEVNRLSNQVLVQTFEDEWGKVQR